MAHLVGSRRHAAAAQPRSPASSRRTTCTSSTRRSTSWCPTCAGSRADRTCRDRRGEPAAARPVAVAGRGRAVLGVPDRHGAGRRARDQLGRRDRVDLSSEVQSADATTKRRMLQQLTESLGSISSVRDVDDHGRPGSRSRSRTAARPPTAATSSATSRSAGSTAASASSTRLGHHARSRRSGASADSLAVHRGIARRGSARRSPCSSADGAVSPGRGRRRTAAARRAARSASPPSLDPSGYTWTVPADAPGRSPAIAPDGDSVLGARPARPTDGSSRSTCRATARACWRRSTPRADRA